MYELIFLSLWRDGNPLEGGQREGEDYCLVLKAHSPVQHQSLPALLNLTFISMATLLFFSKIWGRKRDLAESSQQLIHSPISKSILVGFSRSRAKAAVLQGAFCQPALRRTWYLWRPMTLCQLSLSGKNSWCASTLSPCWSFQLLEQLCGISCINRKQWGKISVVNGPTRVTCACL